MRKTPSSPSADVLAGDEGQQLGGVARRGRQLLAVEGRQGAQRVVDQGVDEGLPGRVVVPVTRRLARRGVVVVADQRRAHPAARLGCRWSSTTSSLRMAARSWVTVSWVATAS